MVDEGDSMVRWNLKSCPRCGSDMYIEKDFETIYKKCLMCSYQIELARVPVKQPVGVGSFVDDEDEFEEE
jgi:DNA-directed RNA polymerase subunit M/transcription elongation factor TFIIS